MCKYCVKINPEERPTISQLIRYFYLNILLESNEKQEIKNELIKILEYNFKIEGLFDPDGFCTLGMIFDHGIYVQKNLITSVNYYACASDQNDLISNIALYIYYSENGNINLAKKYLEKGAELNDEYAQFLLGIYYLSNNFDPDIRKSIEYFNRSADQNFMASQLNLGIIYYNFKDLNKLNKSLKYFKLVVDHSAIIKPSNNEFYNYHGKYILPCHDIIKQYEVYNGKHLKIQSMYMLGNNYYFGLITKRNISKSIEYFKKIVKYEDFSLEKFYAENNLNEEYFVQDVELQKIFKYAINYLIAQSNCILGIIYADGVYVPKDIDEGIKYLQYSANRDNLNALISLGILYSSEYNYINISYAINYFLQAEKEYKLNSYSINNYIGSYIFKFSNLMKDIMQPLINQINRNMSIIPYNIALIYYEGVLVKRDINKAIKFFEYSAKHNNSESLYILGMIYLKGEIATKNIKNAINYLILSAKLENSNSQYQLGMIYYEGKLKTKEIEKALQYLTDAAKKKHAAAQFTLGVIYFLGDEVNKNVSKAISYFKDAANKNDPYSKNNLGVIFRHRNDIKNCINYSFEYLNESKNINNNYTARYNLAHIYFFGDKSEQNFDIDEKDLNQSIKLLVSPSIPYKLGLHFLCLVIIQKCKELTIDNIEKEIHDYVPEKSKSIATNIMNEIDLNDLTNLENYTIMYEHIKKNELIFRDYHTVIMINTEENYEKTQNKNIIDPKKKNIDRHFWEGFGLFL